MIDYTTKIKEICDALRSINMILDEDEMVHIFLAQRYNSIRTAICTREKPSTFFDQQPMLLVEENHAVASRNTYVSIQMLYTEADRPRDRGGRGGSACTNSGRNDQRSNRREERIQGPSMSRGSEDGAEIWQES